MAAILLGKTPRTVFDESKQSKNTKTHSSTRPEVVDIAARQQSSQTEIANYGRLRDTTDIKRGLKTADCRFQMAPLLEAVRTQHLRPAGFWISLSHSIGMDRYWTP